MGSMAKKKTTRKKRARKPKVTPDYPGSEQGRGLEEPWDYAGAPRDEPERDDPLDAQGLKTPEPPEVSTRSSKPDRTGDPRYFLQPDEEAPTHYAKRPPLPCTFCGRRLLDNTGRAVRVKAFSHDGAVVYLYSQCCRRPWKLPVRLTQ